MNDTDNLYSLALAADDHFEAAIKAQFGSSASRWDHREATYNAATLAAREAKYTADAALRRAVRAELRQA